MGSEFLIMQGKKATLISDFGIYHADFQSTLQKHAGFEFHLILEGFGKFYLGETAFSVMPGDFFLNKPHEGHILSAGLKGEKIWQIAFRIYPEHLPENWQIDFFDLAKGFKRRRLGRIWLNRFDQLRNYWSLPSPAQNERAGYYRFISLWQDIQLESSPAEEQLASPLERVVELMYASIGGQLKLSDMAFRADMSESHLIREFKKIKKLTPMQYFMGLKLDYAASKIRTSSDSLSFVAEESGFRDVFYFSRAFRKWHGVSPSHYRKRYSTTGHESPLGF